MKKALVVAVTSLAIALVLTVTALGAPTAPLYTFVLDPNCGNTYGGGTVQLYQGTAPDTMKMKLTLTGALNPDWVSPFPGFDVIITMSLPDYSWSSTTTVGTIYPSKSGDAALVSTISCPGLGSSYNMSVELRIQTGHLMQYAGSAGLISFVNPIPLKLPLELRCGNTSGSGFVALDDGASSCTADMKVILDGALPNQGYDVIWSHCNTTVGTLLTDKHGGGKLEYTLSWAAAGTHDFRIELRLNGGPNDGLLQYATQGLTISVD